MSREKSWFVIINPTSGNGQSKRKWPLIQNLLNTYGFKFEFAFTEYQGHSQELVQTSINQGLKNIICVGGDGTLHNVINGIQKQNSVTSSEIMIGVIPIGTGNDWVKTYDIPLNIEQAISIINKGTVFKQDLGKIEFLDHISEPIYFNNLSGVGFDGYVVSKVGKFKYLGALAYLIGAISGLFSFKNFPVTISLNDEELKTKALMVLVGLCRYSGGGMQLTRLPNPNDGLFDVSVAKDMNKLEIILNLFKLFNGKITNHSKVNTYKTRAVSINTGSKNKPLIQADGELVGKGSIKLTLIPKAFSFYAPKKALNINT